VELKQEINFTFEEKFRNFMELYIGYDGTGQLCVPPCYPRQCPSARRWMEPACGDMQFEEGQNEITDRTTRTVERL